MKKRKLFGSLISEKNNIKISIILGARQVGKTTILNELYQNLINDNNGIYLDLDILSNYEKVSTYENLINTLKLKGYKENQTEIFYLFLDEFQRYREFSKILKNVFDHHKKIKIYATGSSSVKIKDEIQESLAGRKIIHNLFPLDFEEFIIFKDNHDASQQLKNVDKLKGNELHIPLLQSLLQEFMVFGGYPEVVLSENKKTKIEVFESIFDLYVKKDLVEYLNINKILNVKRLIEILAINHAQKIKFEEIASICALKEYEVKSYIEILKETFLISEVRPYFTNKNKELVKIPKIYFIDNGVRNFFMNQFGNIDNRQDSGFLFESYVLSELAKHGCKNIKFWQDKNNHEVDFIIDKVHEQIPIEVKYKRKLKHEDFIGLRAFIRQYPQTEETFLVNPALQNTQTIEKTPVSLKLPYNLDLC